MTRLVKLSARQSVEASRLIGLDLDGTLVYHKLQYVWHVVNLVQFMHSLEPVNMRVTLDFWFAKRARDDIIRTEFGWPKEDTLDWWGTFNQYDTPQARLKHTEPFEGASAALASWQAKGKKLVVITACPSDKAGAQFRLLGVDKVKVITANELTSLPLKPNPQALIQAMESARVSPSETCYIGDSREDHEFALNAGVAFVHHQPLDKNLTGGYKPETAISFSDWRQLILA